MEPTGQIASRPERAAPRSAVARPTLGAAVRPGPVPPSDGGAPAGGALLGALVALVGVMPILAGLGVPPFDRAPAEAPGWVPIVAGAMFVVAGLAVWAQGSPARHAVAEAAGFAVAVGLAVLAHWVALGPGRRACTSTLSAFWVTTWRRAPELECRIAFGVGALMLDAVLLLMLVHALGRRLGPYRLGRALERAGQALLVGTLLPFVVLVALLALAGAAWHGLRARRGSTLR